MPEKPIAYWNQLAVRAAADPAALTELYTHFFPRVYNFVYSRLKQAAQTDDVVSETFTKALTHLADYDAEKAAFSTWLFRIAANTQASSFRGAPAHEATWEDFFDPASDDTAGPESRILAKEGQDELLKAMDQLSDRERQILELKYWSDLSNKEIAELLAVSPSHVGVIHFRALGKLKKCLPTD